MQRKEYIASAKVKKPRIWKFDFSISFSISFASFSPRFQLHRLPRDIHIKISDIFDRLRSGHSARFPCSFWVLLLEQLYLELLFRQNLLFFFFFFRRGLRKKTNGLLSLSRISVGNSVRSLRWIHRIGPSKKQKTKHIYIYINNRCQRKFRIIPFKDFVCHFSSDRSHMISPKTGKWLSPPPKYPPIQNNGVSTNLAEYRNMERDDDDDDDTNFGRILTISEFFEFFKGPSCADYESFKKTKSSQSPKALYISRWREQ